MLLSVLVALAGCDDDGSGYAGPSITSTPETEVATGSPYTYVVEAGGNPEPMIYVTGLPGWLGFDDVDTISGTPSLVDAGTTGTITVIATNRIPSDATQPFTIYVRPVATITGTPPPTALAGTAYGYTIAVAGDPAPEISVSGLPAWLGFDGADTIAGTPAPADAGLTGTITITASNDVDPDATQEFTIDVQTPPAITSAPATTVTRNTAYTYTVTAAGNPAPAISVAGLPSWLTFDGADTISGVPRPPEIGATGTITVTGANGLSPDATQEFTIDVALPPDDGYEDNDLWTSPWGTVLAEGEWLSAFGGDEGVQLDDDWYEILVPDGEDFVGVRCGFLHAGGNVDIELCDDFGVLIASSASTTDDERVLVDLLEAGYPTGGTFYIRVHGGDAGNFYDLRWKAPPEDAYEFNDHIGAAWDFTGGQGQWLSAYGGEEGVQNDEDWYEVEVASGGDTILLVNLIFTHAAGDIDLALYDDLGNPVASAASQTNNEFLYVDVAAGYPSGGTFYVRLYYGDAGNAYDLRWEVLAPAPEDTYEENDVRLDAWDFTGGKGTPLSLYGTGPGLQWDDDWYKVQVPVAGDPVLAVDVTFTHAEGDIDLELYDDGGGLVRFAESTTDNESMKVDVVAEGYALGDTFYVRVYYANQGNGYDLTWDVIADDTYEENDDRPSAWDFTGGMGQLLSAYGGEPGRQWDDDWYKVQVPVAVNSVLTVDATFAHAEGDIDLELYDDAGSPIRWAESGTDNEHIMVDVVAEGYALGDTFYVRVYYANQGNAYDLTWDVIASLPDDGYEDNDDRGSAWDLTGDKGTPITATQWDDDWYMIDVPAGETLVDVYCTFTHADGDIDIELCDDVGGWVADSLTLADYESIYVDVAPLGYPTGGTFYVRVYYANQGNDYDLTWDTYAP